MFDWVLNMTLALVLQDIIKNPKPQSHVVVG